MIPSRIWFGLLAIIPCKKHRHAIKLKILFPPIIFQDLKNLFQLLILNDKKFFSEFLSSAFCLQINQIFQNRQRSFQKEKPNHYLWINILIKNNFKNPRHNLISKKCHERRHNSGSKELSLTTPQFLFNF